MGGPRVFSSDDRIDAAEAHVQTTEVPAGPELPWGARAACCSVSVVRPGHELALAGRLDVQAAADVRLALVAAVDDGAGELVLDLCGLATLDATGLGVLVGAHRRAQRAGRVLVLRDVAPAVARLLFLTRLDKVLRTVRTAPEH